MNADAQPIEQAEPVLQAALPAEPSGPFSSLQPITAAGGPVDTTKP